MNDQFVKWLLWGCGCLQTIQFFVCPFYGQEIILFSCPFQAMTNLNSMKLWSKHIEVISSQCTAVQQAKVCQPDMFKDYTFSPLHRFCRGKFNNYTNICPPSSTLHLSNMPSSIQESDLKQIFITQGLNIIAFRFFVGNRKMALVQLPKPGRNTHIYSTYCSQYSSVPNPIIVFKNSQRFTNIILVVCQNIFIGVS